MSWLFKKKTPNHPLIDLFKNITENRRVLEWFEKASQGYSSLPADVAIKVKEAMDISYTITSMTGCRDIDLIMAAKDRNFSSINDAMYKAEGTMERTQRSEGSALNHIVDWANKYDIPEYSLMDSMAYKERGVPRDIKKLKKLRYLFIEPGLDIEYIPKEIFALPLLQAIAIPGNKIKNIPLEIYMCPSLQRLDLEDNEIVRVEDGIDKLTNVHTIDLSGNKLLYITSDIASMPSLRKLNISSQHTEIDIMRSHNTPLSEENLNALYGLYNRIDMKY